MTLSTADFAAFHAAVHGGKQPFAWQSRLLEQVTRDRRWPRVLDLPTGAGKTTCIDLALFALALDADQSPEERWCPRRIVMVVDRRIVVDQVAERGRRILRALTSSPDAVVAEVSRRLRGLTRTEHEPLGVFTLRGGMPKDDGWARTPDQPLVIASTVDQVGSRMLMQGYGVSQGMKPVHAGLLANDTLLLLDEVHLSEPFRQTLEQLARLRERFADSGLRARFDHAFLSATPGESQAEPFQLRDEDKAPDAPLGLRLHARKPVRLEDVEDRKALEKACVDEAAKLVERHRTIAVIVNRVSSAGAIARQLEERLCRDTTVTLLTGRMRPLDRDERLHELRPAVETGRTRSEDAPRRVVVGTQALEAGADFDFDALVSESASLDALRQRFGRVDRLGVYRNAEGVIVHDKSTKDDPVYGKAIIETVKWLKEQEKERPKKLKSELKRLKDEAKKLKGDARQRADEEIERLQSLDFGVLALEAPSGAELQPLLAPKPNAPTLLPAYMDLWAQTSPAPSQLPDVSLWLHGPSSGPADVQVVWRADLRAEVLDNGALEVATSTVAAVRPSSLEAVSLPFTVARAWLAGQHAQEFGDTEGAPQELGRDHKRSPGRRALRWSGDDSEIIVAQAEAEPCLRPGDTIVVPADYGGIRQGCFDPEAREPVEDLAERAELFARARPVLRLHPAIAAGLGLSLPLDEPDEARAALGRVARESDGPAWRRIWAEGLSKGNTTVVVRGEPGWTVLEARRLALSTLRRTLPIGATIEDGVELTTDGDDSFHGGRVVSLAVHSGDVERYARDYARACGLPSALAEHVAMAAWLHDIGKADRRFQLMLRGGSEVDLYKDETLWAKSAMPPSAREAHRIAQARSRYPRGARHEVQSLAMLHSSLDRVQATLAKTVGDAKVDLELVLHLIASHHGYCRPFAPAVTDERPVEVSLAEHRSEAFGAMNFTSTSSDNGLHRLDAPLADRFWSLVAKYGWLELCWLEAILRLADHRASEAERAGEGAS
jgi:CRISPR-associated endonuclease/helicase Cas3